MFWHIYKFLVIEMENCRYKINGECDYLPMYSGNGKFLRMECKGKSSELCIHRPTKFNFSAILSSTSPSGSVSRKCLTFDEYAERNWDIGWNVLPPPLKHAKMRGLVQEYLGVHRR